MLTSLALPLALLLTQQQSIADRLAGRVPPDIAALATELATDAAGRGLPIDPIIQKAIEGSAKRVPAERVGAAMRLVVTQLDAAAGGLRDGNAALSADTVAIAAGAFALTAGLSGRDIATLARSGSPPAEVIVGLRVAGTLVALGVPASETMTLVTGTLQAGRPAGELLALPGRVQAEVAKGVTPAQAAAGLARAAAAQARRGPPPGRGQPPPHPTPPPHP
ncbi:MAG TPA: hypothetical protein VN803_10175 [Gemmatimonadales bacterium]|nr:hypothetical protein [Gemmatimonadales bacterium]